MIMKWFKTSYELNIVQQMDSGQLAQIATHRRVYVLDHLSIYANIGTHNDIIIMTCMRLFLLMHQNVQYPSTHEYIHTCTCTCLWTYTHMHACIRTYLGAYVWSCFHTHVCACRITELGLESNKIHASANDEHEIKRIKIKKIFVP